MQTRQRIHPWLPRALPALAAILLCGRALGDEAARRGAIFAECTRGVRAILHGWLEHKLDAETGLFSRGGRWDYANEAADHYSSLVLMAHYVEPDHIAPGGPLHRTLTRSIELCTTPSGLPAPLDLASGERGAPRIAGIAEWLRDGLVRIVEVLGTDNAWYDEMRRLCDALIAEGARRGGLARLVAGHEARGNLLQTLARLYALSGDVRYLQAAESLADEYLQHDPLERVGHVRFVDHGCELVPGLAELLVVECRLKRPKADAYRAALRRILDRLVERARHPETGLWARRVDLVRGKAERGQPPDTWGYVLFALDSYDRATGENRYRDVLRKPVTWLLEHRGRFEKHHATLWPANRNIDDWSDSYESMIVLAGRQPDLPGAFDWLDWATRQGGHRARRADARYGPGSGGHFDGSTGRTLCLHRMLCSAGVRPLPADGDLECGAQQAGDALRIVLHSRSGWNGRLHFDGPRWQARGVPLDWARINEMPRWFVVDPDRPYEVTGLAPGPLRRTGNKLIAGLAARVEAGKTRELHVRPTAAQ